MIRALVIGVGILLLGELIWVLCFLFETYSTLMAWILWLFPAIAAFVIAYLAPRKKFLMGMLIAVCGAVLYGTSNLIFEAVGLPVDFYGVKGGLIVLTLILVNNVVLCSISSTVGYLLSRKKNKQ